MKVRAVRVFSTVQGNPPVEVPEVVRTSVANGVYTVQQASGMIYRFPTAMILFATETPPRRQP